MGLLALKLDGNTCLLILVIKNTCYLTVTLFITFGMNKLGGHKIWPAQLVIWNERLMTSAKNVCSYFLRVYQYD